MDEYLELEVIFDEPNIAALHETVASILNQLKIRDINMYVIFTNHTNVDISREVSLLKDANILIGKPKLAKPRFTLKIKSGNVISRTYLYKAISYLKHNSIIAVAPEYTFCRVEKLSLMAYVQNDDLLPEILENVIIDTQKVKNNHDYSPRVKIVRDTAGAVLSTFDSPSELIEQTEQRSVASLPYETLLTSQNIALAAQGEHVSNQNRLSKKQRVIKKVKKLSGRSSAVKKLISLFEKRDANSINYEKYLATPYISNTMKLEILGLADISYCLKGIMDMRFINLTSCLASQTEVHLSTVNKIISQLEHEKYSYFMVLPWIIAGGIDLFAINYIKTLASLGEDVLVIITNDHHLSFTKEQMQLPDNVDIIDFPRLANADESLLDNIPEIINTLVSIYKPKRFHNIASEQGYKSLARYGDNIRKSAKIIYSSYNYILGDKGEYIGYTVQELPRVFRPGDIITTDNRRSKKIWTDHYNINPDDILVHNQLFKAGKINPKNPADSAKKILWAAHVRPEKNPIIVPQIAEELQKDGIEIDCYGLFDSSQWEDENNPLDSNVSNVHYRGPYENFFDDIKLEDYDLFLYTSLTDGMPNVVIEAGLAGLPIVSSAIGGIPDLVQDDAILIKDPNSVEDFVKAIRKVIKNPSEAKKAATALQKRLTINHGEERFIQQVKEMLDRSK